VQWGPIPAAVAKGVAGDSSTHMPRVAMLEAAVKIDVGQQVKVRRQCKIVDEDDIKLAGETKKADKTKTQVADNIRLAGETKTVDKTKTQVANDIRKVDETMIAMVAN
ncbi:hypothetical protein BG006_002591, partial [Podila minutissima]